MSNTRRLSPVLRIGQRTNKTREFQLTEELHGSDPVDLQDADTVYLTMEHDKHAYTAIEGGECTITDTEYGTVEYEFDVSETSLHGRYRVQFEVGWVGGETSLYPSDDSSWVLDVGRRVPDKQPLEYPRLMVSEGTFDNLQVDSLTVEEAKIHDLVGDPAIDELSINTLDVDSLDGGVVSDGPLDGTLHGPGLSVDDGDLAVTLDVEEIDGLANPFQEHADANNYDINNLRHLYTQNITVNGDGPIQGVDPDVLDSTGVLVGGVRNPLEEVLDLDFHNLVNGATIETQAVEITQEPSEANHAVRAADLADLESDTEERTADGVTESFTWDTGFMNIGWHSVTPKTPAASANHHIEIDGSQITVNYNAPPREGQDLEWSWVVSDGPIGTISTGGANDNWVYVDADEGASGVNGALESAESNNNDGVYVYGRGTYELSETIEVPSDMTLEVSNSVHFEVPSDHNLTLYDAGYWSVTDEDVDNPDDYDFEDGEGDGPYYYALVTNERDDEFDALSDAENIHIKGGSWDASIPEDDGRWSGIWMQEVDGLKVEDVTISEIGTHVPRGMGILLGYCTDYEVVDSYAENAGYDAMRVSGASDGEWRNCTANNTSGGSGGLQVTGFEDNGRNDMPESVRVDSCHSNDSIYMHGIVDSGGVEDVHFINCDARQLQLIDSCIDFVVRDNNVDHSIRLDNNREGGVMRGTFWDNNLITERSESYLISTRDGRPAEMDLTFKGDTSRSFRYMDIAAYNVDDSWKFEIRGADHRGHGDEDGTFIDFSDNTAEIEIMRIQNSVFKNGFGVLSADNIGYLAIRGTLLDEYREGFDGDTIATTFEHLGNDDLEGEVFN